MIFRPKGRFVCQRITRVLRTVKRELLDHSNWLDECVNVPVAVMGPPHLQPEDAKLLVLEDANHAS